MKESRHSEQKHGRTIAGLYDTTGQTRPFFFFFFPFKRLLTSSYTVNEGELAHILSFSGSKGQEVFNEAGRINTTWLSLTLLGFNLNDINNFHNASNSN